MSAGVRPPLPPGPYLVVGLARSGQAVARMLAARGEHVVACDTGEPDAILPVGVNVHLGVDGVSLLSEGIATVVKSPGVPNDAPVIEAARRWGIEVVGELELAWRLLPNRFVAVTGTNGKTTTVELLGAIWRAAGLPVAVAGNVGTPLSSLVGELDPAATVICEASSFQLEDTVAFAPEVAILLNIEDDHLDRHGDLASYTAAKQRIFANQGRQDWAFVPSHLSHVVSHSWWEGFDGETEIRDGQLWFRGEPIPLDEIRLRGAHNYENIAAAALAADESDVPREAIFEALRTFPGVEHRLEEVATVDGVLYINDSKATNPASALRGLQAFEGGIHAILGGSLKGGGFTALRDEVSTRCRACYLVGEAADRLAEDLDGCAPLHHSGTLEQAVADASAAAEPGDVVLLSPACASFDSFANYEQRGRRFKELVAALESGE